MKTKHFYNRTTDFFGLGVELITLMFLIPFIPQLSSGLGLTITAFSWLFALRSLTGLISPAVGILGDRYGKRLVMVMALIL